MKNRIIFKGHVSCLMSNQGCNLRRFGRGSVGKHVTVCFAVTAWNVTSLVVLNEKITKKLNFLWSLQLVTWQIASAAKKGRLGFAWRNNEDIKTSWLWEFPVRWTSYLLLFVKNYFRVTACHIWVGLFSSPPLQGLSCKTKRRCEYTHCGDITPALMHAHSTRSRSPQELR